MKKSVIALVLLTAIGVIFIYQQKNGNASLSRSMLEQIEIYLQHSASIRIIQCDYSGDKQTNKVLLNSSDSVEINSFLNMLISQISVSRYETVINEMPVFTPDYRVELGCALPAVLDFVFYEDTNAVCLRNEDHYLFAEFTLEAGETINSYFGKIKSKQQ